MVLDLSSYNGKVDFEKVNKAANIERVILRGTTRNGNIDTRFIEHTYCQVFDGTNADKFTVLPLFTNGYYYLEGRTDGGIKLFSIEVSNSQGNLMYRWSQKSLGYLKYVKAGTFDDDYTGKCVGGRYLGTRCSGEMTLK